MDLKEFQGNTEEQQLEIVVKLVEAAPATLFEKFSLVIETNNARRLNRATEELSRHTGNLVRHTRILTSATWALGLVAVVQIAVMIWTRIN